MILYYSITGGSKELKNGGNQGEGQSTPIRQNYQLLRTMTAEGRALGDAPHCDSESLQWRGTGSEGCSSSTPHT